MQNTPSKSTPIILIVVVVLAVVGYYLYASGNQTVNNATSKIAAFTGGGDTASSTDNGVGTDVLILLNRIQSIKIDPAFFTDQAYQTLVDYTVAIPTWNVGRDNPFAPLPGSTVTPPPAPSASTRR